MKVGSASSIRAKMKQIIQGIRFEGSRAQMRDSQPVTVASVLAAWDQGYERLPGVSWERRLSDLSPEANRGKCVILAMKGAGSERMEDLVLMCGTSSIKLVRMHLVRTASGGHTLVAHEVLAEYSWEGSKLNAAAGELVRVGNEW